MSPNTSPGPDGPLTGVRVLEFGSTVAGPFCGRLLADFGAEVIKVEPPGGDPLRTMGKQFRGRSLYAASIFRNKKLIALNLHEPAARDIVRRLVPRCDVMIENFRPGAMERWNLGYAQLEPLNPGLVMVRISGFGQDGPYAARPGFGVIGEAMSGLRHLTGDPDRPPARVAVSLTDYITGLYGAFGAVMALLVRRQTGRGQYIDAALYESAFSFLEPHIPAFDKLRHVANRAGSRLPDNVPNDLFATADGGFVHIAAIGDSVFRRFAAAIGQPGLADDPRFRTAAARVQNEEELHAIISRWTAARTVAAAECELHAADIPASRIYTMEDIFSDPHYRARSSLVDVPDPGLGSVKLACVTPRLSRTPGRIRHAGSGKVGLDTREVLRRLADLPDAEIDRLHASGAIHCAGVPSSSEGCHAR